MKKRMFRVAMVAGLSCIVGLTSTAAVWAESATELAAETTDAGYDSTYNVSGEGDVILQVMITSLGDADGGPFLRQVMDDYMKMYPNVTLEPVECSMNDLYTTLITRSTSNTLPDIFTMSEAYSANCKEMEMGVDNLDELLGQDFMDNLLKVAVENSTVDGEFVYMPWQNNTTAMVYRKDLFEENGIEIPKTWDEFRAAAEKLTDGDRYGAVFCGTRNDSAESRFQTFALTYGCDFLTQDGDKLTCNFDSQEFKDAMQSYIDLAANDGICPGGFIETGYSEAYTMIAAEQACMFFGSSNVLGAIYNANPDMKGKMGSFPMPTADGVDPVTSFSSVGMTIARTCEHPEVAADFLKFLSSNKNSMDWNKATCRLPVVKSALEEIIANDDTYSGFAEASDSAVTYPSFAGLSELRDECGECWQSVVSGGVSVEDAVQTAIDKSNDTMKTYSE